MTLVRFFVSGLLFKTATLFVPHHAFSQELHFITHSAQHYTFVKNGGVIGKPHSGRRAFYVELVREVMSEMDVSYPISNYPFVRGLREVQTKDNIAFFNLTRTAEREDTVKWVFPLHSTTSFFFESKEAPTGIKSFEEAKKVSTIGVLRGGVHETTLLKKGFENLHPVNSYEQILLMLQLGRIDLTASSRDLTKIQPSDPTMGMLQNTGVKVSDAEGYLSFSRNVSDSLVTQWQEAFERVKSKGKIVTLKNRFLFPVSRKNETPSTTY